MTICKLSSIQTQKSCWVTSITKPAVSIATLGTESNISEIAPNQSSGTMLVVKTTHLTRLLMVLLFEKYLTIRNGHPSFLWASEISAVNERPTQLNKSDVEMKTSGMSSSLISNAVSILDKLQPTESSSVYISMQSKCKFCSS